MRRRIFAYALLIGFTGWSAADTEHKHPDHGTPNPLQDPSAMNGRLEQTLERVRVANHPVRKRVDGSGNNHELQDPTRMNQNFRDALDYNVQRKPGGNGAAAAPLAPEIPDIRLVASVFDAAKEKAAVMLRINGKSEMAHQGEKITVMTGSQLITIEIMDIQKGFVTVNVLPMNGTLILR